LSAGVTPKNKQLRSKERWIRNRGERGRI